jgi:hypothetical protein
MITARDAIPTTIPIQSDPTLSQASISGSNEIPTDVAVAIIPVIPALKELVSIVLHILLIV